VSSKTPLQSRLNHKAEKQITIILLLKINLFVVLHKSMDQLSASQSPIPHSIHTIIYKFKITFGIILIVYLNIQEENLINIFNDMIIKFSQAQNTKTIKI
jgi:hypothetical protein